MTELLLERYATTSISFCIGLLLVIKKPDQPAEYSWQLSIWWVQESVRYYELLNPVVTINGDATDNNSSK